MSERYICTVCGGSGFTEDGGSPIGRAFLMGVNKGKEFDQEARTELFDAARAVLMCSLGRIPEEVRDRLKAAIAKATPTSERAELAAGGAT